ncbi:CHAT domain-containing protein [Lewinella sp. W8]|uniref:CHAT domain-containing protein n=1 Tax=Lewinella sp. W8 TaxID=2528208 RepID=UPI00106820ED|nr:CHAT domain-containing protein [Lewinella sp. W8]MTB51698.1 CHAT domain-containing protein [Lewinella sp. W8]
MSDIKAGEAVLASNPEYQGKPDWIELCNLLANFYLEVPEGNRQDNLVRAKQLYVMLLGQDPSLHVMAKSLNGLANIVGLDSESTDADFDVAISKLKSFLVRYEKKAAPHQITTLLGTSAFLLMKRPGGDRIGALEEALQLRKKVVTILESAPELSSSAARSRALYNLAATHLEQESGIRSDHINSAILRLQEALPMRPTESDPHGREKILRALAAIYPEWTGADSLAHARAWAQAAAAEAQQLANTTSSVKAREQGFANFDRQSSALGIEFDGLEQSSPETIHQYLTALLSNHQKALEHYSREDRPTKWAEWTGGIGRILATYYLYLQQDNFLPEAFASYEAALERITPDGHPRLYQELQERIGELAHAAEDWERSMNAHLAAIEIGNSLYQLSKTKESQEDVLKTMRGYFIFGAYAAARGQQREVAVELAERGLARGSVEQILAAEIELTSLPEKVVEKVRAARSRVSELERQLRTEGTDSIREVTNKLSDFVQRSPDDLSLRITKDPKGVVDKAASARIELGNQLAEARKALRTVLAEAQAHAGTLPTTELSAKDISAFAESVGYPIIYLLATMHGTMALIVSPNGLIYTLSISGFGSRETNILLHGNEELPGYLRAAIYEEVEDLQESLNTCVPLLGGIISTITDTLNKMGHAEAALIPLGSLGQLPLHAATYESNVVFRMLPSARVLAPLLANRTNASSGREPTLFALAPPDRKDEEELPYALVETLVTATQFEGTGHGVKLAAKGAKNDEFFAAASSSTHLHLACHAKFSPADPLSSRVVIGTDNELILEELIHHQGDLSGVQLAVLSACQTAISDADLPDESTGFPNALLTVGVQNVVTTSWSVNDLAALFFSHHFYQQIDAGKSAAEATAVANRWLSTLTAEELAAEAKQMQSSIPADDFTAQNSINQIIAHYGLSRSQRPFEDWIHCAAFSCYGL